MRRHGRGRRRAARPRGRWSMRRAGVASRRRSATPTSCSSRRARRASTRRSTGRRSSARSRRHQRPLPRRRRSRRRSGSRTGSAARASPRRAAPVRRSRRGRGEPVGPGRRSRHGPHARRRRHRRHRRPRPRSPARRPTWRRWSCRDRSTPTTRIHATPTPPSDPDESHRGAFGEFGGESDALHRPLLPGADRAGRRGHPPRRRRRSTAPSTSCRAWSTPPAPTRSAASCSAAPRRIRPPTSARARPSEIRELAVATDCDTVVFDDELSPAQQRNLEKLLGPHGHRPHRGDPRHLRPERPQPGGQGAGRAGAAPLPAAPAPRQGPLAVPAGRRHRYPRGPGETQLEVDRRRLLRRDPQARGASSATSPATATPSASRAAGPGSATS